jgi:hypothetical protein
MMKMIIIFFVLFLVMEHQWNETDRGHTIRLQGKLNVTEKEKHLHILSFYYIFFDVPIY